MSTTDEVLVIILITLLSVFFLLCIIAMTVIIKLINSLREIVAKADDVIDSVESAAETFKNTQGKMAIFKLINSSANLPNRTAMLPIIRLSIPPP